MEKIIIKENWKPSTLVPCSLFDNAAFVRIHVIERFSKDFLKISWKYKGWKVEDLSFGWLDYNCAVCVIMKNKFNLLAISQDMLES